MGFWNVPDVYADFWVEHDWWRVAANLEETGNFMLQVVEVKANQIISSANRLSVTRISRQKRSWPNWYLKNTYLSY